MKPAAFKSSRRRLRLLLPSLAILIILGVAVIFAHFSALSMDLIRAKTIYDAELYLEALQEFRTLYTSEVVEIVRPQGISATHDYEAHPGNIPLPATLTMLLGKRIGEQVTGARTRLYSPYPFPWRKEDGGLRDQFQKDAWARFQRDPKTPFYRFEEQNGRLSIRYAAPDLMRQSCVDCHNTHPDSPRKDWKEGDVRGILEVVLPMDRIADETRGRLRGTLYGMVGAAAIAIGLLAFAFGRLGRARGELERRVVELSQAQSSLRAANDELTAARDEAMAADRAKSRFLANVSHELRTPLNAIIGYSEMLREDGASAPPDQAAEDLAKISTAGKNLLALVEDVLDIANFDAESATLDLAPISIVDIVHEAAAVGHAKALEQANSFEARCPANIGAMTTDAAKLRRCLAILIDNAAKFTKGGRIALEVGRESGAAHDWITFAVTDTGVGIPPEQLKNLFQPFMQTNSDYTREHGGMGMGLALAWRLVRLMGGQIEASSVPGKGSNFKVRLPAEAGRAAASATGGGAA